MLEDVSFAVSPGRSLAIVGATGSGKSTLVDLLVRAHDPDRGSIRLDGVDVRQLSLEELRRSGARAPGDLPLRETLRDNVLLGRPTTGDWSEWRR